MKTYDEADAETLARCVTVDVAMATPDDVMLTEVLGVPNHHAKQVLKHMGDPFPDVVRVWMEEMAGVYAPGLDDTTHNADLAGAPLVLYGPAGTGKTITAIRALLTLVRQGWWNPAAPKNQQLGCALGRYMDWQKLSAEFRYQASGKADDVESEELDRLLMGGYGPGYRTGGQFLVIDDVSRERGTEYNLDRLQFYIRHRVDNSLPLIITTNYAPEQWASKYGDTMANFLDRSSVKAGFIREEPMRVPRGRS